MKGLQKWKAMSISICIPSTQEMFPIKIVDYNNVCVSIYNYIPFVKNLMVS